jgi:hypothetical protein
VSQPEGRKDGYTEEGYKKVALNATLPKSTEGEGGKKVLGKDSNRVPLQKHS